MGPPNPSIHPRNKKKGKNETPEAKFRSELDLCSKKKDLSGAISLFDAAVSQSIRFNLSHFNTLLYLCSSAVADSTSSEALDLATKLALEHGFRIFDHMRSCSVPPNEATITAMARLYAAKGDGDSAFELVKTMGKHGALPRLRTYGPVLLCFCGKLEVGKAYEVEEHMVGMGVSPEEPELAALLDVSSKSGSEDKVYEYLHKLRTGVRCVSESTAEIVERWFGGRDACKVEGGVVDLGWIKEAMARNGSGWHGLGWLGKGHWVVLRSSVDNNGHCCTCNEQLACVDIGSVETETFALSVASLAMERETKTNFKEFQIWLDKHTDYEAIVDGANVGLYQQNFAEGGFSVSQLDAIMKELYNRNGKKKPLVILHNKRLRALADHPSDQKLLQDWMDQGKLYATPNGSNDDWYWLYAAVKLKCLIVTNDEMRDHIFELLGGSYFLKWKERHQARYTFVKGNLKLQMPPSYSVFIQESEKGSWHVPLAGETCGESLRTWLCITRPGSVESSDVRSNGHDSKLGQPVGCNHTKLTFCTSKDAVGSGFNGTADSFQVFSDDNRISVTGKRKDRSPSPSSLCSS